MSTDYSVPLKDSVELEQRLEACSRKLSLIKVEEKHKYENPQYRLWSGNTKDLEGFASRLEEWLNQPSVAESKRFLLDLKKWSGPSEEVILGELEKDWRFLSDNIEDIKSLHENVGNILHETIKARVSMYVLKRLVEKDTQRAKLWSANASKFSSKLTQFEQEKAESKLASELKKDAVKQLLKENSFDTDNEAKLVEYNELKTKAEAIIKNKPEEIAEEAVLNSYRKSKGIEEALSIIISEMDNISKLLIDLEWIKESPSNADCCRLWSGKRTALKNGDLESIRKELSVVRQQVDSWKNGRKRELENILMRIERMNRLVESENLTQTIDVEDLELKIDWNKPNLDDILGILSKANELEQKLRVNLIGKLKNEDAISIIEEPEIIEDFGKSKSWEFDRFMKALEIVLRNGLIAIKAAEEK